MNRFACAVFLAAALAEVAGATDWPVGTPAEIALAAATARPGDALVLVAGEWKDVEIVLSATGSADKPITLRSELPGKTIIAGQSRLRIAGSHLVVEGLLFERAWHKTALIEFRKDSRTFADHCRLTNCALVDCNPPDGELESKWLSIYGRGNRVDHCYLAGKTNLGTAAVVWLTDNPADGPAQHRIDHNHFGPRPPQKKNGAETIRIGDSKTSLTSARCIVEANLFEECNGEVEIVSNKSCDNIYRGNTFLRCAGALTLRHGHRCTVAGNFFLGQHARRTGGVRVIGEDHLVINNYFSELEGDGSRAALSLMNGIPDSPLAGYSQTKRALVAFNTLVDCKQNFAVGLADDEAVLPPQDCRIANNLVVGRTAPLVQIVTPPERMQWHGNLLFSARVGLQELAGVQELDPRLEKANDGLLRPAANSPAIGAALGSVPEIKTDIDGQPRGEKLDVGCDQLSTAPVKYRPLTARDVGPSWFRER